jgi:sigma-B regulation protein RsbU (phosphoserine phosphatase)
MMLTRMNHFLLERTAGEKYATLCYCVLEADGALLCSNAAHCPPLVVRSDGEMEKLAASGMAVGMLDFASYAVNRYQLLPGDKVLFYSDGVTEARDSQGGFFGEKRLREVARGHARAGCRELHDAIRTAVRVFSEGRPPDDDVTVLVIEYHPE